MQTKLDFLLNKYEAGLQAKLLDNCSVAVGDQTLPLLPWRSERRFMELKKLVDDGELSGISVMRSLRIVAKDSDLFAEAYREFDLCQYILGSPITEVFAIGDEAHALNMIAKTKEGYVCSFEIAATLDPQDPILDKHEIIALSGVACDRAADTQVPQNSIYVYGSKGQQTYTDVDAELFGLNVDQCAVVRAAFEVARTGKDLSAEASALQKLVAAAKKSLGTTENVFVEE